MGHVLASYGLTAAAEMMKRQLHKLGMVQQELGVLQQEVNMWWRRLCRMHWG